MTLRLARQCAGLLVVGVVGMCVASAWACDVPVFRYALEYWPAARYQVTVLHRAPLSAREREAFQLVGAAPSQGVPRANVTGRLVDLTDSANANSQRLWGELGSPALPLLVLHDSHTGRPIWSAALTAGNVAKVVDSPARREIARRILGGHSAVWVLLQCGDRAKDSAAKALLGETLRELEHTLKLPVAQGSAPPSRDEPVVSARPPLQVRFSPLTVSRHDAAESVFVQLLVNSEPDLGRYASEPIVFPVYGRGRVLYALVGKGITQENLREAGAFLVGSCSCEAKEQNPGTDLLLAADWEGKLVDSAQQAAGPQPLVGLATLSKAARRTEAARVHKAPAQAFTGGQASLRPPPRAPSAETTAPPDPSAARPSPHPAAAAPPPRARADGPPPGPPGGPLRNILIALGAILVIASLLGVLAARRRPEEQP